MISKLVVHTYGDCPLEILQKVMSGTDCINDLFMESGQILNIEKPYLRFVHFVDGDTCYVVTNDVGNSFSEQENDEFILQMLNNFFIGFDMQGDITNRPLFDYKGFTDWDEDLEEYEYGIAIPIGSDYPYKTYAYLIPRIADAG